MIENLSSDGLQNISRRAISASPNKRSSRFDMEIVASACTFSPTAGNKAAHVYFVWCFIVRKAYISENTEHAIFCRNIAYPRIKALNFVDYQFSKKKYFFTAFLIPVAIFVKPFLIVVY
eukprot:RCo025033